MNKKRTLLDLHDRNNRMLLVGIVITVLITLTAIVLPLFMTYGPDDTDPAIRLTPVFTDPAHLLGTDAIGRDMLARILSGVRTSLIVSACAVAIGMVLGVILGIIAGFSNGLADTIIMRLADIQMGLPFIVLAIIVLTLMKPTIVTVTLVLSLSIWPGYARSVRANVLLQKNMEYITEARLLGASNWRIYTKYVGVNLIPSFLPLIPLDIAGMIINERLLSFMQLGIKPPRISIGSMMADAMGYISTDAWYITTPGVVILILILGLNFIGDSLQIKMNSKLNR